MKRYLSLAGAALLGLVLGAIATESGRAYAAQAYQTTIARISGGTINGAVINSSSIGLTTAGAGAFTTATFNGNNAVDIAGWRGMGWTGPSALWIGNVGGTQWTSVTTYVQGVARVTATTSGVDMLGTITMPGARLTNAAEPACDATTRGSLVHVHAGAGVADTVRICTKDAANAYAYRALF